MARREFFAKLIRVIDGDTVELCMDCGFYNTHTSHFRLAGINAPEHDIHATNALKDLLSAFGDGWFKVMVDKADKYGRFLVTIPLYEMATGTVNQQMIDKGFAVAYDGGKR